MRRYFKTANGKLVLRDEATAAAEGYTRPSAEEIVAHLESQANPPHVGHSGRRGRGPALRPDGTVDRSITPPIHVGAAQDGGAGGGDDHITLKKLRSFMERARKLLVQGAVPPEVAEYRQGICGGVEGLNAPCPNLGVARDGVSRYCKSCGCGQREMAVLFVEGKPLNESLRLFMPDPNCPIRAIRPFPGTGTLAHVGGRAVVMLRLLKFAALEMKRLGVKKDERKALLNEIRETLTRPRSAAKGQSTN